MLGSWVVRKAARHDVNINVFARSLAEFECVCVCERDSDMSRVACGVEGGGRLGHNCVLGCR